MYELIGANPSPYSRKLRAVLRYRRLPHIWRLNRPTMSPEIDAIKPKLIPILRFPFLTLVTMRGEWGEFNPWQVPMGSTTQGVFELSGVQVLRASHASEVPAVLEAAAAQAYNALTPTAVLLSQRLIGAKVFTK